MLNDICAKLAGFFVILFIMSQGVKSNSLIIN